MAFSKNPIPLSQEQVTEAGVGLGRALDVRHLRNHSHQVLAMLDLDAETLRSVMQLSERALTKLDLPTSDPVLYKKLKALAKLSNNCRSL